MLKRPLNSRFREPVLAGIKTTTIRDRAWPAGVPIMLYSWSGEPYRSKHVDVAPVKLVGFWTIRISHLPNGSMVYECGKTSGPALHVTEGFNSREEMDAWFREKIPPGTGVKKILMLFRRVKA